MSYMYDIHIGHAIAVHTCFILQGGGAFWLKPDDVNLHTFLQGANAEIQKVCYPSST